MNSDGTANAILTILGKNGEPSKDYIIIKDGVIPTPNPISELRNAGGWKVFGDNYGVFANGVFNPSAQLLGAVSEKIASSAGGISIGQSAGLLRIYAGTGAPSAIYPVTTGIPANGYLYLRLDGTVGSTLYRVVAGAWVGIL
jgi:hypothetical protein